MKLGKETGSFINWVSAENNTPPVVGKGATELHWTDRSAWFVNEVTDGGKRCIIEKANAVRIDDRGMCETQDYRYERTGHTLELRFKWGKWRYQGGNEWNKNKWYPKNIVFGYMNEYYDFSF